MRKIILKITHDGGKWVVKNESLILSSPTLDEIDARIGDVLRGSGLIKPGERVRLKMEFDNSSIPQWIRQYTQHYFDRIIEIEG